MDSGLILVQKALDLGKIWNLGQLICCFTRLMTSYRGVTACVTERALGIKRSQCQSTYGSIH